MANAEEEIAPRSIKDRIAALKLNQAQQETLASPPPTYRQAVAEKRKVPRPPLPKRPAEHRANSTNNPPVLSNGISSTGLIGNQPANPEASPPPAASPAPGLPLRPASPSINEPMPALPPRRPSEIQQHSRRPSTESVASTVSVRSTGSALSSRTSSSTPGSRARVLAPNYDPANLPPLPARKKEEAETNGQPRAPLRAAQSTSSSPAPSQRKTSPAPPALPGRTALPARPAQKAEESIPTPAPVRHEVKAPLPPRRSALDFGTNKATTEKPHPKPSPRPSTDEPASSTPPPIPMGSRPDLAALQASKPKMNGTPGSTSSAGCLICRDFSGPDNHAARFPRQSIPSQDPKWLARELTAPFSSHTDKARALFTWLHHNVAYDTVSFFNNNVKPSTPSGVIASGLAVCEGYAGLFSALALAAGMEALTVGGHGKGYGYGPLAAGSPMPPQSMNHAWNAVKIDDGRWKLIDCCWGAGSLCTNKREYTKRFSPERFTQSNEDFGIDHWPEDRRHFYRVDGRALSWEEYILQDGGGNEKRMVYGNVTKNHGVRTESIEPAHKRIALNDPAAPGPTLRFQMTKVCRHWRNEVVGEGPDRLFLLEVGGRDGRDKDMRPLEHDGYFWWVDVPRAELGAPGMNVRLVAVTMIDGRDARGLKKEVYLQKKGRCAMAWEYVADWDLVH